MFEKHFEVQCDGLRYFLVVDTINERCIARLDTKLDADAYLEIVEDYEELVRENEELKKENEGLRITKNFWREQCGYRINEHKHQYFINNYRCSADDFIIELRILYEGLKKENEDLTKEMKKAYTILNEVNFFSDKATTHDLIAYSEMLKLDNKDVYAIVNGINEVMEILKECG